MYKRQLRTWNENIEEIVIDKGKKKKKTVLSDEQIAKVKELYCNWQDVDTSKYSDIPEYCKSATIKDFRSKDYTLTPSKYIKFIDHDLDIVFTDELSLIHI